MSNYPFTSNADYAAVHVMDTRYKDPVTLQSYELLNRNAGGGGGGDPARRKAHKPSSFGAWWLEYLGCIGSVAALAAIVVVLRLRDGRPLPDWPYSISINTLVSVFAAVLKLALAIPVSEGLSELKWMWYSRSRPVIDLERFESASRGPLGSIKFLFRMPFGSPLATVAAFITIVSLAIDPFTQQILRYSPCVAVQATGQATVPRTSYLDSPGTILGPGLISIDNAMMAAIYQGLLNPPANMTSILPTNCPSGNCTFSGQNEVAYSSLAMCFDVQDISDQIVAADSQGDNSFRVANFSLPSGASIGSTIYLATSEITSSFAGQADRPLYAFDTLVSNATVTNSDHYIPYNVSAFRTTLTPCVQSYSGVSITRGILSETIHMTTSLLYINTTLPYYSLASNIPGLAGTDCTPSTSSTSTKTKPAASITGGDDDGNRFVNATDNDNAALPDLLWYNPNCTWLWDEYSTMPLAQTLDTFLGNQQLTGNSASHAGMNAGLNGSAWIFPLYAGGNASLATTTAYARNLTNALTASVRQRGAAENSTSAPGDVLITQTCVAVRWPWLGLPAGLVAMTVLFLLATVVRSARHVRREGRGVWKSSPMPGLWCGLQEKTRAREGLVEEVEEMEERSKKLRVRLERDEAGYGGESEGVWTLKEE